MAYTENYPTGWSTVHIGLPIRITNSAVFDDMRGAAQANAWNILIEGDGWQDWGTPLSTGDNDNETVHVQIATPDHMGAARAVRLLRGSGLPFAARMTPESRPAYTIAVTAAEDPSVTLYTELFGTVTKP